MSSENPIHVPAIDVYADLEDLQRAAEALGLIVAAFLDDDILPLDALYTDPVPCRLVLSRHDDLYAMLKESHVSRDFSALRGHAALRRQCCSDDISQVISELVTGLISLVDGGSPVVWSLPTDIVVDKDVHAHIESLKIPCVNGPSVLLRDLGSFSEDAVLSNRVRNIFAKGRHTFLVNASGSGKTRLALEGLCQNWGLYLVGEVDSIGTGSGDLQSLLDMDIVYTKTFHIPAASCADVAQNVEITQRCLRKLLLCRLLVLSSFAEHVGTRSEYKKTWLLLQAFPHTLHRSDIFYSLLVQIARTDDDNYVKDYIASILAKLRTIFGEEFHLFCVIDEAQTIFQRPSFTTAFQKDGVFYPILREILDAIAGEFRSHEISFVTVGTQIPTSGFRDSMNVDRHRWCSDTGAFDEEQSHRQYISRYLPSMYTETRAGKAFLQLVWQWCRGRYRVTDSLMATLLRDGFRSPHSLLADYIETGTGYRPHSNLDFAKSENIQRADIEISLIDCKTFESGSGKQVASAVLEALFHFSVTGQPLPPLSVDHIRIVSNAFGRIADTDMSRIVIDEPVMLVSAAKWFCTTFVPRGDNINPPASSQRESLLDVLQLYPPITLRNFLASLVIYLTRAFSEGHPVNKVFSFPYSSPVWAKQKAEVVVLHHRPRGKKAWHCTSVDPSTTLLATVPTSSDDLISWLAHKDPDSPPFCLPSEGEPDLVCVLRLADGTFLRIILRAAATTSVFRDSDLRKKIKSMDDANIFPFENLGLHEEAIALLRSFPPSSSATRRSRTLRVIASFPAPVYIKTAANRSTHGVAALNIGLFKKVTATIAASEVLEFMVEAVTSGNRIRIRKRPSTGPDPSAKRRRISETVTGISR